MKNITDHSRRPISSFLKGKSRLFNSYYSDDFEIESPSLRGDRGYNFTFLIEDDLSSLDLDSFIDLDSFSEMSRNWYYGE